MSCFLDGISTIISVFHKQAKEDGDCSNLSRRKMKEFIQREFADVIDKPHDPQTIDKILKFLEWDDDGKIDFNEFLLLVFGVAKACYWYLPKGPCLLQRTKLTTTGKSLREPDIKNRGISRQFQEEEQKASEGNHHPPCELQEDTRINELETLEEEGSHHQQPNTQSRNDAKQRTKEGRLIPHVYEERSQEPCNQQNSQRRRQPLEPDRREDVQLSQRSSLQAHEPRVQENERQNQEGLQSEQLEDVRSCSQTCEPQPLPNRWSNHQPHEPALPAHDQINQRPQEEDRRSQNQPHKPELLTRQRNRYDVRDLEQKALERSSHQPREPECLDSTRPYQSYIQEPLEINLRNYETREAERDIYEQEKNKENELTYPESKRDVHHEQKQEERDNAGRKKSVYERRIEDQWEVQLEANERCSRQTREREERGVTADLRETRERRDPLIREPEDEGRRQGESVRFEWMQDMAEEEADTKIHQVSREQENHDDMEKREHRTVSREVEPRDELERKECLHECKESEDDRRTCRQREREEPVVDRRTDRQRELDLEASERRNRQTREREERGVTTDLRETRKRRDPPTREPKDEGMRQRESVRFERTRETAEAEAEADIKVHRVSSKRENHDEVESGQRPRVCKEPEDGRRTCRQREREEPMDDRRTDCQRELDLEAYERRSRQTREREERGATTDLRETRERRDPPTREPKDEGRRQRESVRFERTQESAEAEGDINVHRVSHEREPRDDVVRRECQPMSCEEEPRDDVERREHPRECEESEDEKKTFQGRDREEPVCNGRTDRQRELEVYERCSRHTQKSGQQVAMGSDEGTCRSSILQRLKDQELEILHSHHGSELHPDARENIPSDPSDDQERSIHQLLHEEEALEENTCRSREDERLRHKKSLYQTVEVDNRDLFPAGQQASVTDMRVRYIPAEPNVPPEVQVLPEPCKPQTIAYLIHVIQNLNDPEATTYKIICHQANDLGQPVYVKKCCVSPQPPAVPCDKSNHPDPRPQNDKRETRESKLPRQGGTPASSSQENTGILNEPQERSEMGVRDRSHQASASEPDGVKGNACQAKLKEDRRDSQHPKMPDVQENEHQPGGDGSKAAREQVLSEPKSSCQLREREDREARSCPPLPQAPEPRDACEPCQQATKENHPQTPRRDETVRCREDAKLPPPEESRQPRQENSKRSPRPARDAQPQREEEPRLCTKQSQGPPVSQEEPSCPARDEAKTS